MTSVQRVAGLPFRVLRRFVSNALFLLRYSMSQALERQRVEAANFQKRIDELQKQLTQATASIEVMVQEHRSFQQEHVQLYEEHTQLHQEHTQLAQEHIELQSEHAALREAHTKLQQDFEPLRHAQQTNKKALEAKLHEHTLHLRELDGFTQQLSRETLCILNTRYGYDPWLEDAKDLHKGERCFLLGCGPSLNAVDLSRLKGERVMGVNGTYLLDELDLDYFISVSRVFWKDHVAGLQEKLRCKRCFLPPYIEVAPASPVTWLRMIEEKDYQRVGDKPWIFSREAHRYICLGGTVIGVGLQILYHMGFEEVILLGVDHDYGLSPEEEKQKGFIKTGQTLSAHFIPNYYQPDSKVYIDMEGAERAYRLAQEAFTRDGRRILNASPGTKLDIYPTVDYDALF